MSASETHIDPREVLEKERMSRLQVIAVAICILLNALDGFDVLAISFASPGIASDWGIDRAQLGFVLSMELIGMAVGAFVIGRAADVYGRRPIILGSLVLMTIGMALAAIAGNVVELSIYRVFTGFGIGGMLASTNPMVAEFANKKNKALAVTFMAGGYPVGAVIGGSVASVLLTSYDWRSVFIFGSILTASFIPLVWFLLPESVYFLTAKQPKGALGKINATLKRLGHSTIEALPPLPSASAAKGALVDLFKDGMAKITILLTLAYFCHIMSFYYIIKWIPKIVADFGFAASAAGGVLVFANIGGASGSVALGLLTRRYGVRGLTIGALLISFIAIIGFGQLEPDLAKFSMVAFMVGFFTNAGVVGLYALFAEYFPTELRGSGTGFAIGLGRGGAALGPIIAGILFESGYDLPAVSFVMAIGAIVGAIVLLTLKPGVSNREATQEA